MKAYFEESETKTFQLAGSRFYFMGGTGAIEVKINSGGDSRAFKLLSGQGINSDDRFSSIQITNISDDQEIEFDVSDREVFDNGILGTVNIEPVGGVMPVSIQSPDPVRVYQSPQDVHVIRASGRLTTNGSDKQVMFSISPQDAVWGDRVFMVDAVNVSLMGGSFKEVINVVLAYSDENLVEDATRYDFKVANLRRFGCGVTDQAVALGAECKWGRVSGTDDLYYGGFDSVLTSSVLPVRNVQFDLRDRNFRFEKRGSAGQCLGVVLTTLDGTPVTDASDYSYLYIDVFGRLV